MNNNECTSDSIFPAAENAEYVRNLLTTSNYIVVKVGSSAIADPSTGLISARIAALADAIAARIARGTKVVLVSSGAIAAGVPLLGLKHRPHDLATKQAAASVGQSALTQAWADAFAPHGHQVAQILLTSADMSYREHHNNAARTFHKLRSLDAIAIVNENDVLATDEIRFGDNDRLAALVTHLVGAQALYLLSDIDAVYTDDPRKKHAEKISFINYPPQLQNINAGKGGTLGTGGMASKLNAALLASHTGIPVLLTNAAQAAAALEGANIGTVFAPAPERLPSKKFWLHSTAESKGTITIDLGAVQALTEHRKSLLAAGITDISGVFFTGNVVNIADPQGAVIARGITSYARYELENWRENQYDNPIVHADDLVTITSVPS